MNVRATPTGDLLRSVAYIDDSDTELRHVLREGANRMASRVEENRQRQDAYARILEGRLGSQKIH